ncbi:uncharacterized protein [Nicotiana tomentosiformis]|uniref:uncharacterized protein isoform X2 n=1 Tax=Nicotiana tomentosiformis TaxID=4098 RepID=UPI00388CCB2F
MRVKKQRRAVWFYTSCFGFREPFKILCDGTFLHHLVVNRITPANIALANILGVTVKLFTTRCVLAELKSLGGCYRESLNVANNLITARCDHEKRKSAVACITEVIGENNSEHFFVATQDAVLRRKRGRGRQFSSSSDYQLSRQMLRGLEVMSRILFASRELKLRVQIHYRQEEKEICGYTCYYIGKGKQEW